jgi:5-methylcytosine-specific restriction endonuclease McrA
MGHTRERLRDIFERTDGHCHICGIRLVFSRYGHPGGWEVEHSIPVSSGGSDRLSNLYAAHMVCNREKGARTTRTARGWHGRSKAPLSHDRKENIRENNRLGWGTAGALTGGAIAGPAGFIVGGILGALFGDGINPE